MARLVFLGTPEAAVPTLRGLSRRHEVALVVTQPDRPRGRSGKPQASPVRTAANELEIPVAQPSSSSELEEAIAGIGEVDLGVVVAYGRILRPEVLDIPGSGFLNVHFSLLPRWRGAAPVERALMAGDQMTGVTIIKLDEGLDTGPVLTAQALDIAPGENRGDLTSRLADLGARLLIDVVDPYLSGSIAPVTQSDEGVTYAHKISKQDRPLKSGLQPDEFASHVRGLAPEPGATLQIDDSTFKVLAARPNPVEVRPGTWRDLEGELVVGLDGGAVVLDEIQPPGRRPMSGAAWLRGQKADSGHVS